MHRDAELHTGNSNSNMNHLVRVLKILNTNTKITKGLQTTIRMERHIILPLRGFDPVACGHMRSTQLWAACFDQPKVTRKNENRDRYTKIQTNRHIDINMDT